MLAWTLFFVLLSSALLFILTHLAETTSTARVSKALFVGYAWIVFVILFVAVMSFLGFGAHGSPTLRTDEQRRMVHLGFYSAAGAPLRFTADENGLGFRHTTLTKDETITLQSGVDWKGRKVDEWRIEYKVNTFPFRLDGQTVNIPEDQWFNPGDTLFVFLGRGDRKVFFAVRWESKRAAFGVIRDYYLYSQGQVKEGAWVYGTDGEGKEVREIVISKRSYEEARKVSTMIRLSSGEFRKRGVVIEPGWWEIFDGITWVREKKGQKASRMGILIAHSLFQNGNVEIYKNSRKLQLQIGRGLKTAPPNTTISYGFGSKAFSLSLTGQLREDHRWGEVVEVLFTAPPTWPLPPNPDAPFILTSTTDYIPLDGYWIPGGDPAQPIYAKAMLSSTRDSLVVNDGKEKREFQLGWPIRMGTPREGVLVSLQPLQAGFTYSGTVAIAILALLTLGFMVVALTEDDERLRLDLAWTLIWGLTLTVLVVRLVLAYRLSLLPPWDADFRQLGTVFHRGLRVSLWALFLLPLTLLVVRCASRGDIGAGRGSGLLKRVSARTRKTINKSPSIVAHVVKKIRKVRPSIVFFLIWGLITITWLFAGRFFGQNESLLGVRINLGTHLLVVVGLVWASKRIMWEDALLGKLAALIYVVVTVVAVIFLIRDTGFLIFLPSLLVYCVAIFMWDKQKCWFSPIAAFLILSPILLGLFVRAPVAQRVLHQIGLETVYYRVVTHTETEKETLLAQGEKTGLNVDLLRQNMQQRWQMLLYAAHGSREPAGYGQARLSDQGMTYPTSMTDGVFSIYLLSEHGKGAGFWLAMIYVLISFSFFYGSWFFPQGYEHRAPLLAAIGAFFGFHSLYMMSANLGLVLFTGQNIPMLALYSGSDVLHASVMLALGAAAVTGGVVTSHDRRLEDQPAVRRFGDSLLVGLLVWAVTLFAWMNRLAGDNLYKRYTADHNLSQEVLRKIEEHLPDLGDSTRQKPWELDKGKLLLVRTKFGSVLDVEDHYANQFNERPDKFDRNGGLYYLERLPEKATYAVRVNRDYFIVRSPFRTDSLWEGLILTADDPEPAVSALGQAFRVSLKESGHAKSIALSARVPIQANKSVLVTENQQPKSPAFFGLIRKGTTLYLEPKKGSWRVFIEGRPATSSTLLQSADIIVIERDRTRREQRLQAEEGKIYRRNLIYLGFQPQILAFAQWRNGRKQRVFPEAAAFPMAYALGKAADHARQLNQLVPSKLVLTIDYRLDRSLKQAVEVFARGDDVYKSNDPVETRILAVTVLNAFSGAVLAVPSWPVARPSHPEFEERARRATGRQQARIITNHNLTNHAIGSTVKPIIFATVATQLWPEIDMADIVVYNRADSVNPTVKKKLVHPHSKLGGIPIDAWDCLSSSSPIDAQSFLVHSRDYYAGVTGMLGMLMRKEDLATAMIPNSSQPDISYKGRTYSLNLARVPESPFTLLDPLPRPLIEDMRKTLLFNGLPLLFGVALGEDNKPDVAGGCRDFLHSLCADGVQAAKNYFLDNVVPEPIVFRPHDFQGLRQDVVSFFLGGGSARWNNVRMAEAAARLATGLRVQARLEVTPESSAKGLSNLGESEKLPSPLGVTEWRNKRLILPMELAGKIGTAKSLDGLVQAPYKIIYKTGTLAEREKIRESDEEVRESEMLMFVIGEWKHDGFVPGRTLAVFIYMQEAKKPKEGMKKFSFARPIIRVLYDYLRHTASSGG